MIFIYKGENIYKTTNFFINYFLSRTGVSFDSYIKPQLMGRNTLILCVVYLLIPTSNHNVNECVFVPIAVVYLLIPTSNHNLTIVSSETDFVVYLLIPTSNHNKTI